MKTTLGQTDRNTRLPLDRIALAGAVAGGVNSVLASPVELIKIRLQSQYGTNTHRGPLHCIQTIVRQDGVWYGLFRGFWATVAREIPAYAGFYAGFEVALRWMHPSSATEQPSVLKLMVSGACGGVCYWTCCYPLDVAKSVAQNSTGKLPPFYVLKVLTNLYRQESLKGWFRGFSPTVLRSIPAAAATFATYEMVMRNLNKL
jgi:solute carrier family 25 carnitine/acylcarnitine transporter 20/29